MSIVTKFGVTPKIARMLVTMGLALAVSQSTAFSQTATACGPEVKEAIAKSLASVENGSDTQKQAMQDDLYKKYSYCGQQDAKFAPSTFVEAARQCGAAVSNLGSIYFEEMSCSGYDPQRRQFASPIKIKQVVGYGGTPIPGSREYVLHCVADPAGVFLPVARDSVHLSNALPGQFPTWQFGVIASATENLQLVQPMNNQTRTVRSILSWAFPPPNCNYVPIWGNALNYRIRLDQ